MFGVCRGKGDHRAESSLSFFETHPRTLGQARRRIQRTEDAISMTGQSLQPDHLVFLQVSAQHRKRSEELSHLRFPLSLKLPPIAEERFPSCRFREQPVHHHCIAAKRKETQICIGPSSLVDHHALGSDDQTNRRALAQSDATQTAKLLVEERVGIAEHSGFGKGNRQDPFRQR